MKHIASYITIFLFAVFASCVKEAGKWERVKTDDVKMITFGFYEADNPTALVKDYVINTLNKSNIVVELPDNADKSSLIARFTVGDNNIVQVGGTVQKSGVTVNDFTVPVDYILSNGNNNAKYTVTIAKGGSFIWSALPFTINDSATTLNLKVNQTTGDPYLLFTESRATTDNQKIAMANFENAAWNYKGEVSDGRVANSDFTFSSTGIPYVSYSDYTATIAQAMTVKRFNTGTSWSIAGSKGMTPAKATYNTLEFASDTKLLVFSMLDAAAGGFVRRELCVSTLDNNILTGNAALPGRSSSQISYLPVAKRKNNAIYLAILNAVSPYSISVYKYANNAWTTIVDQWRDPNATATGFSVRDFAMDVDNQGNVYVAFADNSSNATLKQRVIKYNATTKTVTPFGSYIAPASGNLFSFDLAISPQGVVYLMHRNSSNYPSLVSFDNDTQDWTLPYVFETEVADELSMDFAPNGEAYAAYIKNKKIIAYKYSAP